MKTLKMLQTCSDGRRFGNEPQVGDVRFQTRREERVALWLAFALTEEGSGKLRTATKLKRTCTAGFGSSRLHSESADERQLVTKKPLHVSVKRLEAKLLSTQSLCAVHRIRCRIYPT
jgi:hypothetical protein